MDNVQVPAEHRSTAFALDPLSDGRDQRIEKAPWLVDGFAVVRSRHHVNPNPKCFFFAYRASEGPANRVLRPSIVHDRYPAVAIPRRRFTHFRTRHTPVRRYDRHWPRVVVLHQRPEVDPGAKDSRAMTSSPNRVHPPDIGPSDSFR